MIKRECGQIIVLLLILLPVLLLIFGLMGRSGRTALVHNQIENHCDRKVLDALAIESQGLQKLGEINDYSRLIIQARRIVDALIIASAYYVISEPVLISTQKALKQAQRAIEKIQKTIKKTTALAFSASLIRPPPSSFLGKIIEKYSPLPLINFYLKADDGYEGETGAPLEPDSLFESKAVASGKIKIFTEKFLWFWPDLKKSSDMFLECKAQIILKRLEDPWKVQLAKPMARPLSNLLSL